MMDLEPGLTEQLPAENNFLSSRRRGGREEKETREGGRESMSHSTFYGRHYKKMKNVLTISPDMEHFVQATILNTPITNHLRVGGTQVNLFIGQFKESGVLFWTNAIGPELIKCCIFLLRTRGEVHTRL